MRDDGVQVALAEAAAPTVVVQGDAVQLAVAIREICINASEAIRRSARAGRIEIAIAASGADRVEVIIRDDGPGLDARARRHLFDPFFSGYESGRGLGFGLTKCWQIIDAHGGEIVVDSTAGEGATFTLRLRRVIA
jgi:C4-dicarboxylate-specific signal transduction histidine kinase